MPFSRAPTYNLKAVLRETGIAADTLRAWERRYGLPMPRRTAGGHRLYSQHDIHLIKWLQARQAEGLSISRAVKRWNEMAASGDDPLEKAWEMETQGLAGAHSNLDAACEEWLAACLAFDESTAERALNQAFALYPVETVITHVMLQGLREVGIRWHEGKATVQQEHFLSSLAMRRLDTLVAATPAPGRPAAIILACPPAELHSLPLLYLNVMLRRRGHNVVFLGADVPTEHLEDTIRTVNPDLVVLAAQRLTTAAALRDTLVRLAKRRVPVAYGGRVFNQIPELRGQMAGEFLGEAIDAAPDRIEQLLERPVTPRHRSATAARPNARAYRVLRAEIESALQRRLGAGADLGADLTIANSYFGSALAAALELGNMAYLSADMEWIRFLLTKPRLPFDTPRAYLAAYSAAVRRVMKSSGGEIADWLEQSAAAN